MATVLEQLDAMRRVGENWDGYGAAAPLASCVEVAREFVALLESLRRNGRQEESAIHVSPTRLGGVLIEWQDATKEHEAEIQPDGGIEFLHVTKATREMETQQDNASGGRSDGVDN